MHYSPSNFYLYILLVYLPCPALRHNRVIEEPEVIYAASDEEEEGSEGEGLPLHRMLQSDSER